MTKQKKTFLVLPKAPCAYAWLNKPDTKYNPDGEYKVTMVYTEEEMQTPLNHDDPEINGKPLIEVLKGMAEASLEEAKEAANAAGKKKLELVLPYSMEEDEETGEETGRYLVPMKLKARVKVKSTGKEFTQKPVLIDAKKQETNVQIWGGSIVRPKVEVRNYSMKNSKKSHPTGISLRLKVVQILELNQGNGGASGFDEEEGFEDDGTYQEAPVNEAPPSDNPVEEPEDDEDEF